MKRLFTILLVTVALGLITFGYFWLENEKSAIEVAGSLTTRLTGVKKTKKTDAMSGAMMSGAVMSGDMMSGAMMTGADAMMMSGANAMMSGTEAKSPAAQ